MKDPGPVIAATEFHKALVEFSNALAKRLEASEHAILGQVLKFEDAIRRAGQTDAGIYNLKIEVTDVCVE